MPAAGQDEVPALCRWYASNRPRELVGTAQVYYNGLVWLGCDSLQRLRILTVLNGK